MVNNSHVTLGPHSPGIATLYHNLGGLDTSADASPRASLTPGAPVEIRERGLGPHHPDVAADLAAHVALLDGQRKFEESNPYTCVRSPSLSRLTGRTTTRSV